MPVLLYGCNRQTKGKLKECKPNTFLCYVKQIYLMKNKTIRKQKAYFIMIV